MNNFENALVDVLKNKGYEVKLQDVTKNNNQLYRALMLNEKGVENTTNPVIYIDNYYEDYLDGKSVLEIADNILSVYCDNKVELTTDDLTKFFYDESAYSVRLVNGVNELDDFIHRPFLNGEFKLLLCIEVNMGSDKGTIKASHKILEMIDKSADDMFDIALKNIKNQLTYQPMLDVLCDIMGEELPEDEFSDKGNMIVISNNQKLFGAIAIADMDFLGEVSKKYFGSRNMVILPSSVHECICIEQPTDCMDYSILRDAVRNINVTQVSKVDWLSDEIFLFDATNKKLNMVK